MSYLTQDKIASNGAMNRRVAQCVAQEAASPLTDPDQWTYDHRRQWAAAPGWAESWESALVSHPNDPDAPPGTDYDPGSDEAVITDSQILSQIQGMLAEPLPT